MEEAAVTLSRRNSLKVLTAAFALPASSRAADTGIQLVVLDVGGTIIEDRGDVVATLQSTLAKRGIAVSAAEIGPWRGAAKRAVVQHFVDLRSKKNDADRRALVDEIYQDFNAQLNEVYRSVPPIAGAEEAIRKLRENGYRLGATTGFDREIVVPIFHRLGWEKYFAAIVASNDVARGRPSPYMLFHAMETAQVDSVGAVMAVETRRSTFRQQTMRACVGWWECFPVPAPKISFAASRTRICSQALRACRLYSDRSTD